jgi:hypothetical protein
MNSKITVEIDFSTEGNPPVLQIMYRQSADTRDNILKAFLELFGHDSSWAKIRWVQDYREGPEHGHFQRIIITPIPPKLLAEEAIYMKDQADLRKQYDARKKDE